MRQACQSPVLFLVFNRPEPTARVFAAIREARPARLYVAADGPRVDQPEEAARTERVREIATAVDWPCQVKTLFRDANLGCGAALAEAITWFFKQEEQGIILEDDCLPHQDFFRYCDELLDRYASDTRIGQISGSSLAANIAPESYAFSRYSDVWGWASWRRAWKIFDLDLKNWGEMRSLRFANAVYRDKRERDYRISLGDRLFRRRTDNWDYQWGLIKQFNQMVSVIPRVNLVENIGFDHDATHCSAGRSPFPAPANFDFEWKHPHFICVNYDYECLLLSVRAPWWTFRRRLGLFIRSPLLRWSLPLVRKLKGNTIKG